MCSQGPSGLDDLHSATNEFLGHFVDVVYKHRGDGKIFSTNWTFYGFLNIVYLTDLIFDFTLSLTGLSFRRLLKLLYSAESSA